MTVNPTPINVLVVEDSATVRMLLVHALESDPQLNVIGAVASGEEAVRFVASTKPDVVLMDIHLPGMNGFQTTRRLMETNAVPIVICSAVEDPNDVATTFEAMEAGALAVLAKPAGPHSPGYAGTMAHLVETVKLMSEIKVVRRWNRRATPPTAGPTPAPAPGATRPIVAGAAKPARVVAIGTSTGGPPVLRSILEELPANFPVPVLVVQHIAPGFLRGLVEWLAQTSRLPVHIALHGERPLPGHVYFAPDGFHLEVAAQGQLALADRCADDVLCPSVSHLFRSLGEVYGPSAVAVLLTGMGKDGARELALLKQRGATTIAQDKTTSIVHGMPGEAIRLDGATYVIPGYEVAPALTRLFAQT